MSADDLREATRRLYDIYSREIDGDPATAEEQMQAEHAYEDAAYLAPSRQPPVPQ